MPPRYAYWTILAGGLPTAFRAAERDDLLPTFKRIQEKHPDAEMKWFARGKLWASPEAARQETEARQFQGTRDRTWRPGGEHRDPRQPFKDAKKERNIARRKQRFERRPVGRAKFARNQGTEEPREPPGQSEPAIPPPGPPERGRPRRNGGPRRNRRRP